VALAAMAMLLAATAAAAPAKPPAPAPAPTGFEAYVSEATLGGLLSAAAPWHQTTSQDYDVLGMTKTVTLDVTVSDPVLRIARDGLHLDVAWHVRSASGVLDANGVALRDLQITAVPAMSAFVLKLVRANVDLPGGIDLPLEQVIDPIELPAVIPQDLDVGDKTVPAEVHLSDVVPEDGRLHLRGSVVYGKPKAH